MYIDLIIPKRLQLFLVNTLLRVIWLVANLNDYLIICLGKFSNILSRLYSCFTFFTKYRAILLGGALLAGGYLLKTTSTFHSLSYSMALISIYSAYTLAIPIACSLSSLLVYYTSSSLFSLLYKVAAQVVNLSTRLINVILQRLTAVNLPAINNQNNIKNDEHTIWQEAYNNPERYSRLINLIPLPSSTSSNFNDRVTSSINNFTIIYGAYSSYNFWSKHNSFADLALSLKNIADLTGKFMREYNILNVASFVTNYMVSLSLAFNVIYKTRNMLAVIEAYLRLMYRCNLEQIKTTKTPLEALYTYYTLLHTDISLMESVPEKLAIGFSDIAVELVALSYLAKYRKLSQLWQQLPAIQLLMSRVYITAVFGSIGNLLAKAYKAWYEPENNSCINSMSRVACSMKQACYNAPFNTVDLLAAANNTFAISLLSNLDNNLSCRDFLLKANSLYYVAALPLIFTHWCLVGDKTKSKQQPTLSKAC